MNETIKQKLLSHLQTAVEIELSTIPIYLYTYYSINRQPQDLDSLPNGKQLATFANKAGGVIMSVAVEEMLHMSLAANLIRALGGEPKMYLRSPKHYSTNLPHHKKGFSVGLSSLSSTQLNLFLGIEKPEAAGAPPEGDNWETIGQFYDYIENLIKEHTTDEDFRNEEYQLGDNKGYYAPNNVDTIYPTDGFYLQTKPDPYHPSSLGADQANYPNNEDSGDLRLIHDKASALKAIQTIKHQGEGYPEDPTHKKDDSEGNEDSHWYKFNELFQEIGGIDQNDLTKILFNFPENPTREKYPQQFHPLVDLTNAVYSYLFLMTETSYRLRGRAQSSMFFIGMHKGMIFILDKIIGDMRYLYLNNEQGEQWAPTFENYSFQSLASAKQELIDLAVNIPASFGLKANIVQRIKDLPDVNVGEDGRVRF